MERSPSIRKWPQGIRRSPNLWANWPRSSSKMDIFPLFRGFALFLQPFSESNPFYCPLKSWETFPMAISCLSTSQTFQSILECSPVTVLLHKYLSVSQVVNKDQGTGMPVIIFTDVVVLLLPSSIPKLTISLQSTWISNYFSPMSTSLER